MAAALWEYKVDIGIINGGKPAPGSLRQRLKKNGDEGWELISVLSYTSNNEREDWYIYKRPLIKNTNSPNPRKK